MKLDWHTPVESIPGLRADQIALLVEQGFRNLGDLLLRAPLRFIDRRASPPFNQLESAAGEVITAVGEVESVGEMGYRAKKRLVCHITDGIGHLTGVWFNNYRYIKAKLIPGRRVAFSGKLSFFDGPQITHPKVTYLDNVSADISEQTGLTPVYPSGEAWEAAGFNRTSWPRLMKRLIERWDGTGPYLPEEIVGREGVLTLAQAVQWLHHPETVDEFDRAMEGLKLTELFFHQTLMVALRRRRRQRLGVKINRGTKFQRFIASLPFELSLSQRTVFGELQADFESGVPMHRLLQGEVGAGKTVIAFGAAAMAADSGFQTVIMAPTDLLARQHYRNALNWCESSGIRSVLLTASRPTEEMNRALYEASVGGADLIIGTHALFQKRVKIPRLALAIIDEQHRFGVRQRASLIAKGSHPHVLLLSATPIPRTLALAHYGDLDMSILSQRQDAVRNVTTRVLNESRRDEVFRWMRGKLAAGAKGYLVFPVIDEGAAALEAVEARFQPYSRVDFKGISTAMIHGRQPVEERIRAMESFRDGRVRLLMATPVVEVGVDVPDAAIMVIENADRFGLAQLHQLRGRVGRQGQRAACVLLTGERNGQPGFRRLQLLETSSDGFSLAEQDLSLRGAGEPLGERQSGAVRFRLADPVADRALLLRAHRNAVQILDQYPDLSPFPELRRKLRDEYRSRPRTLQAG